MSTGRDMIVAERLRQIGGEGYTHGHDDIHPEGTLEQAGWCYLYMTHAVEAPPDVMYLFWPWHPRRWKPHPDRIRNMVKAGALFLAEAERYERAGKLDQAERLKAMAGNVAAEIDTPFHL